MEAQWYGNEVCLVLVFYLQGVLSQCQKRSTLAADFEIYAVVLKMLSTTIRIYHERF